MLRATIDKHLKTCGLVGHPNSRIGLVLVLTAWSAASLCFDVKVAFSEPRCLRLEDGHDSDAYGRGMPSSSAILGASLNDMLSAFVLECLPNALSFDLEGEPTVVG